MWPQMYRSSTQSHGLPRPAAPCSLPWGCPRYPHSDILHKFAAHVHMCILMPRQQPKLVRLEAAVLAPLFVKAKGPKLGSSQPVIGNPRLPPILCELALLCNTPGICYDHLDSDGTGAVLQCPQPTWCTTHIGYIPSPYELYNVLRPDFLQRKHCQT